MSAKNQTPLLRRAARTLSHGAVSPAQPHGCVSSSAPELSADAENKTYHDMDTTLHASNSSEFQVSEFIPLGFPGIHEWQHWFSLPMALLYLIALGANLLILITIYHEPSLHQPMYQFLGILAAVDIGLATTSMPKILAILWFDAKAISLPECFAQIYAIHSFMCMESGIFLCMAVDRYVAICYPLQYPSIVTEAFVIKATISMLLRNGLLTVPVPVLAAQRQYCSRTEIDHCLCSNLGVTSLACDDITVNRFYSWLWPGLWSEVT
ncbi:Olfactory receptor 688 [Microtus ochrogaster]|uniref:Olfactory receptor 688 n=1 Tax=Microtus ochrogaster TaxID=79684 RepID=A0A8J6GR37_MICOH|nr:Olfactory receptor 688 [Microtus ochrogaster]